MTFRTVCLFALLSFPACVPVDDDGGAADGGEPPGDNGVKTGDKGDGSYLSIVDARDEQAWKYFDFETRKQVGEDSSAWDLGFLRFNIQTHASVASVEGTTFEALTVAPRDGYATDMASADPEDMETMPGYAFDLWYVYNPATHVLSPSDVLYVVKTPEGNYFKVEMTGYYDDAGTAGYVGLHWAPVDPPV